jgi:ATP-binding cassette, subfamily B, bacterial CvaB/MchF/RaxB
MGIATLVMMFIYAPQLALIVVGAFGLYAGLRLGLYRIFRQRS